MRCPACRRPAHGVRTDQHRRRLCELQCLGDPARARRCAHRILLESEVPGDVAAHGLARKAKKTVLEPFTPRQDVLLVRFERRRIHTVSDVASAHECGAAAVIRSTLGIGIDCPGQISSISACDGAKRGGFKGRTWREVQLSGRRHGCTRGRSCGASVSIRDVANQRKRDSDSCSFASGERAVPSPSRVPAPYAMAETHPAWRFDLRAERLSCWIAVPELMVSARRWREANPGPFAATCS